MSFSMAFKFSLLFLLGLGVEVILSYFIFSSYAFYMTGEGENYASPQVYSGPAGTLAKVFYGLMGLTVAGVIIPPVIAAGTWILGTYRQRFKGKTDPPPPET